MHSETATVAADAPDPVRPVVGRPQSHRGVWLFALFLVLAAAGLFSVLEARRSAISSPATSIPQGELAPGGTAVRIAAPPALVLPPEPSSTVDFVPPASAAMQPAPLAPADVPSPRSARSAYAPPQPIQPAPAAQPVPMVVYQAPSSAAVPGDGPAAARPKERVEASRFDHPATTIPKGAVIQAVLETALDSTRPGLARAIVSRDVKSFDGTRVLIARGSRLYGEYKADLGQGQNRALIQWERLMRPDGVVIQLDSPSADPLGRAGVAGKVNSHFFARFAGALLQSSLDIGVGLATRSATGGTVILGLPGSTQNMLPVPAENVRPTLKVAQGTPVSVFVARDLDFTVVEQAGERE